MDQAINKVDRKRLDPAKTRETILASALSIFAEKGYTGSSIGDIAAKAGVPKSLVQYHFGSKEDLWQACVASRAAPMIAELDRFLAGESTNVVDLVSARFDVLRHNPELARLLAWASMSTVPLPAFIETRRQAVADRFGQTLDSPQFSRFLLALAAMDGWFLYRNLYKSLLGEEILEEAIADNFKEMLLEMVAKP